MRSDSALLLERLEDGSHRTFACEHDIDWELYQASVQQSPQKTLEQMEGIAEILGVIANTIAQLAHRNQLLEVELSGKKAGDPHRLLIQRAVQYMQDQVEEPISIAKVASEIGLNPSYFSTVFTEQMGCLPVDYLARLRIERAKEYLRHSPLSVMEVCVALNYTPSYFNRLFKRLVGMTPGEYARQARQTV
jgi:AraC-like DNA-binding protein